jgi:CDP-glycerol:poly(glycerophosphate) glycerophosphotransferase
MGFVSTTKTLQKNGFRIIKLLIPKGRVREILADVVFQTKISNIKRKQRNTLIRLKTKAKIKVAFFLIHESIWKYEGVYRLIEKDKRFDPIVVVCPYIAYGEETMFRDMNKAYNFFITRGYNVVRTFNEDTKEWLDVKKHIKPDIIFFTNPYKLTKDEYYITNFLDYLTCYVQYSFTIANLNKQIYDQLFHNLLWKAFYETNIHKELAIENSRNRGCNVEVTGYPGVDILLNKKYIPSDVWKIQAKQLKRIIWAPHHTIESGGILDYSNFLFYADFMVEVAKEYQDRIQIAFKPHPILKSKLYEYTEWGKMRTNEYFKKWQLLPNGQLEESAYEDLFLTSDAMIHDSGSFMTEYLFTGKPSLFTVRDKDLINRLNPFGQMVFDQLYHAIDEKEIIIFIEEVVIRGEDNLRNKRLEFYNNNLRLPGNSSASESIFKIISDSITK